MTMFLVGSGPADSLDRVHDQFVESAKKRGTRIAIAILGTQEESLEHLAAYAGPITERWPEAQVEPVWLDDEPDPARNATVWPEQPMDLAGLVVAGGWTPGYLEALRPRRELLGTLVRRGVPYLGFSAGAMVVGKRAIIGGWRFRGRQVAPEIWGEGLEELQLRDGLALIGPAVDVHADVSGLGMGLAAIEKGEVGSVVAIDEGTCLVIDPVSGRTTVEGSQRIHWLTKDGDATMVRHESGVSELERHKTYIPAEQEAAEQEAAARRAEQERLAAERAERERQLAEERAARQAKLAEERRKEAKRLEAEQAVLLARQAERQRIADEKAAAARAAAELAREQQRIADEKKKGDKRLVDREAQARAEQRAERAARAAARRQEANRRRAEERRAAGRRRRLEKVAREKQLGDRRLHLADAPAASEEPAKGPTTDIIELSGQEPVDAARTTQDAAEGTASTSRRARRTVSRHKKAGDARLATTVPDETDDLPEQEDASDESRGQRIVDRSAAVEAALVAADEAAAVEAEPDPLRVDDHDDEGSALA